MTDAEYSKLSGIVERADSVINRRIYLLNISNALSSRWAEDDFKRIFEAAGPMSQSDKQAAINAWRDGINRAVDALGKDFADLKA